MVKLPETDGIGFATNALLINSSITTANNSFLVLYTRTLPALYLPGIQYIVRSTSSAYIHRIQYTRYIYRYYSEYNTVPYIPLYTVGTYLQYLPTSHHGMYVVPRFMLSRRRRIMDFDHFDLVSFTLRDDIILLF